MILIHKHAPKQKWCLKINPVMPILQLNCHKKSKLTPKYVSGEIKDEVTIVLLQGLDFCKVTLYSWNSAQLCWLFSSYECQTALGRWGRTIIQFSKVKNKTQKGHLSNIRSVAEHELQSSVHIMGITLLRLLLGSIAVELSLQKGQWPRSKSQTLSRA